jgi:hypothetical protein
MPTRILADLAVIFAGIAAQGCHELSGKLVLPRTYALRTSGVQVVLVRPGLGVKKATAGDPGIGQFWLLQASQAVQNRRLPIRQTCRVTFAISKNALRLMQNLDYCY